jgi:hypothetical protein
VLALLGSYYDAYQRDSLRDFRTGTAGARLGLRIRGPVRPALRIGYRGLQYKPLEDYNFHALRGGFDLSAALVSGEPDAPVDWNLALTYTAALRSFTGNLVGVPAEASADARPIKEGDRQDLSQLLRLSVSYLGNADASLWYVLEHNQSNSYGETFTRHALGLKFTHQLFWEAYLTVKGVLQLSSFDDPFLISQTSTTSFVSIEDENRSRLIVQLSRDITANIAVALRYSLYVNESVSHQELPQSEDISPFMRQTLFGGVRFELEGAL